MNQLNQIDFDSRLMKFNGDDYQPERDNPRLIGQILRIWEVMRDEDWHTLSEIERRTGDPQSSISAQLRHLRKKRFGQHTIEKEYMSNGLYQYRLIINDLFDEFVYRGG